MIPDRRRRRIRGFLARLTWPLRRAPRRAKDQRAYDLETAWMWRKRRRS